MSPWSAVHNSNYPRQNNMKKLIFALALTFAVQSVYAFGFFPRHRHSDFSGSPARNGASDVIPPIPEPETYLYMLVGIGLAAWIIRKNKK
jgi:hypothetical protein